MKCAHCKRAIAAGVEARKMIVEYTQADGSVKTYGYLMPDGPLTAATGRISRGWHCKCYHLVRKRSARGNAVTGRTLGGAVPTAYEVSDLVRNRDQLDPTIQDQHRGTVGVTERLDAARAFARTLGRGVGDPVVREAFLAHEHGGPYPHTHDMALDPAQLKAHLIYAHGRAVGGQGLAEHNNELHAAAALADTLAAREADPGHTGIPLKDWRTQTTVDINELQ